MARSCRRCFRCNNRSLFSTMLYAFALIVVLTIFTTTFSSGRPNDPIEVRDAGHDAGRPHAVERDNVFREIPEGNNINIVPIQAKQAPVDVVYPQFAPNRKFIPSQRIVHLDLKGGAYKPHFFAKIFEYMKKMEFTGILLEWEDMFPYTGKLNSALNGYAYSMSDIKNILKSAAQHNLEVIPLVQTIGHLEWLLKLPEFENLREDPSFPQVICFGSTEAYNLIVDMIDQVAAVHREFGMNYFHMGADEVFQVGVCNATVQQMRKEGNRDRVMLWHLARVAKYITSKYSVKVLAWHDMFAHIMEEDLQAYKLTELMQPVLWSYAEDLDMYLPYSTWAALKPFGNVWGASAFKGADGPLRINSHPMHYVRNHESWVDQFNRVYRDFTRIEGLIYTGWSRYDHLAILCELLPVALPQLAMSAETMLEAKKMSGHYPKTQSWLQCEPTTEAMSFSRGCQFPGSRIYELVNEFSDRRLRALKFMAEDFDFNGWLSKVAINYTMSSPMYIDKILPNLDFHLGPLEAIETEFRKEAAEIYYQETADEYVYNYMSDVLEALRSRRKAALRLRQTRTFPKRPFIVYPPKSEL